MEIACLPRSTPSDPDMYIGIREAFVTQSLSAPAAEYPGVADEPRDGVGVHSLEEELRGLAADAEEVARAREGDRALRAALRDDRLAGPGVRSGADRKAVAHAHQPALAL